MFLVACSVLLGLVAAAPAHAGDTAAPVSRAPPEPSGLTGLDPVPPACGDTAALLKDRLPSQPDDATRTERHPPQVSLTITPDCRLAIGHGRWPALSRTLVALAAHDGAMKREVCEVAPPEALPAIVEWLRADAGADPDRWRYEEICALALARERPAEVERLVVSRLSQPQVCRVDDLALRLTRQLPPTQDRAALLPALAAVTRARLSGRDELFGLVCEDPRARPAKACQDPARLEPSWASHAHLRRVAPALVLDVGGALAYGLLCIFLWRRARDGWPATTLSVIGAMATSIPLWWWIVNSSPSAGETNWLKFGLAALATPLVALGAALVTWLLIRKVKVLALPWCLFQMAFYLALTVTPLWRSGWDPIC